MNEENDTTHKEEYARTWGTELGQDCITLKTSLSEWLGPRLVFLAEHTTSMAPGSYESEEAHEAATEAYLGQMKAHGEALIEYGKNEDDYRSAEEALSWVAGNFIHLWD